jgi:hypothetical protein
MKYADKTNANCPVCGQRINFLHRHPVVYRVDNIETRGHLWCEKCFVELYSQYTGTRESQVEQFQSAIKLAVDKAYSKITDRTFPSIKGFWFCNFDNIGIGLVVNYSTEE